MQRVHAILVFFLILFCPIDAIIYSGISQMTQIAEKPICVIIPSFNNVRWYRYNIDSVMQQQYQNYRVFYIDDCSTDGMSDEISAYIEEYDHAKRWSYVRNDRNCGALFNLYHAIHSLPDNVIIVTLDGDDWFKHSHVLARVNFEYQNENVWMTYGQFEWWPSEKRGHCKDIPAEYRSHVVIRQYCGLASHLRTFYAWLFKKIKYEDLLYEGKFFPVAWDYAIMAPMLEMASPDHFRCIEDILYVYNATNPISDFRKARKEQLDLGVLIQTMPCYLPLAVT